MAKQPAPSTKVLMSPAAIELIRYGNDLMAAARNLQDLAPSASGDAHKHRKMLRERAQKILSIAASMLSQEEAPTNEVPV